MVDLKSKAFATRAVHAGERAAAGAYTSVVGPIFPSVGYTYESAEDLDAVLGATQPGYVYMRYGNPTVAAFETAAADLEGAEAAMAFSSGMAAIHTALLAAGARAGTTVVAAMDVYGATFSLLQRLLASLGIDAQMVDVTDLGGVEAAIAQYHPVAVFAETVSNPLLKVADLAALAGLARRYGAQFLVDNTFASPYLCNPIRYGADYVIHSATKYLSGHGDVMAGVVATSAQNRSLLYDLKNLTGGVLGPFEAWLALRGIKTLPLRISRQCANAQRLAEWLNARPGIRKVNYPGLPDFPQHALATRQFGERGFGGVLSFEIAGADRAAVFRFMEALRLCQAATTMGDLYTLVLYPVQASHRSLTPEERARVGIGEGLVRVSAGIEDPQDIIADLDQALQKA